MILTDVYYVKLFGICSAFSFGGREEEREAGREGEKEKQKLFGDDGSRGFIFLVFLCMSPQSLCG